MALATVAALVATGCPDDGARTTGTASASVGSASSDSTDGSVTLTSADSSSGSSSATSADTSGSTTTDATTTDATTTDATTTDTDSTTGDPVLPGQTQSQLVNVGERMSSTNYQMVFTLGQPSQLQSTHNSTNYRIQGGLIGANGSPP